MATLWILARLDDNATGERTPPAFATSLARRLEPLFRETRILDPLDAWFLPCDGDLGFRHEAGPLEAPDYVLTLLDPFRPDTDLLFLEALALEDGRILNTPKSLTLFRDPVLPSIALAGADVPAVPVARVRRPHALDNIITEFGLPLEARIPMADRRWGRTRFEDRGSLRAIVDLLWREDVPAFIAPAPEDGESEWWVPVVGGETVGEDAPDAANAAEVLGLDLCAVRLRSNGRKTAVVEVVPWPAAPEEIPSEDALKAIGDLFEEPTDGQ